MSESNVTPIRPEEPAEEKRSPSPDFYIYDSTLPRILSYLASVRPLWDIDDDEAYARGHAAIHRLAMSAHGFDEPEIRLTMQDCVDVIHFMRSVERCPGIESSPPVSDWQGLDCIYEALETAIRRAATRGARGQGRKSKREARSSAPTR
jgi:hypothetical protein